jgi:hypothetical protein
MIMRSVPQSINVLLPNLERNHSPPIVAKKLTPLRIGVAILDGTPTPLRIVFE